MTLKRIISRIDIKGADLVKGVNLEGLRVLGNPEKFSNKYYKDGIDEIFVQDVVASLYGRNNLHQIISKISENIFIPITVGGGIRSIDDINKILRSGADRVSINSAGILNPDFINDAVLKFGASTISISIEVIKNNGNFYIYYDSGREESGILLTDWINKIQNIGVGEISITSVVNEGTGLGFDYEILELIKNQIEVPLIIHGGFGNKLQVLDLFKNYDVVDGVCIGSMLHYNYLDNKDTKVENLEGNFEFLKNKKNLLNRFEKVDIPNLKQFLIDGGINTRICKYDY